MKRWLLGALALVVAGLAVGAGLVLWTDIFITSFTIEVENRTSEVVQIGISDGDIGCGDSDSVSPNSTSRVKLKLDGGVLCKGVTDPYWLSVTTRDKDWVCYWPGIEVSPVVVVADDGVDCGVLGEAHELP